MVLEKIVSLIESIEVDGQKRKISQSELKRSFCTTQKEGYFDTIYVIFSQKDDSEDLARFYNKWYFRFHNKFVKEFTDSDEDYLSMCDNNTKINFYTDWLGKLEYDVRGLYIKLNVAEFEAYLRNKKIDQLLK